MFVGRKRFIPFIIMLSVFLGSCFLEQYNPDKSMVIKVKFPSNQAYFSKALLKPQDAGVTYVPSFVDRIQMTLTPRNGDPITICRTKEAVDGCSLVSDLSNEFDMGRIDCTYYALEVEAYTYNQREKVWIRTHRGSFPSILLGSGFEGYVVDADLNIVEPDPALKKGLPLDSQSITIDTAQTVTTTESGEPVLNPPGHPHTEDYCMGLDEKGNFALAWIGEESVRSAVYDSHGDQMAPVRDLYDISSFSNYWISKSCGFLNDEFMVSLSVVDDGGIGIIILRYDYISNEVETEDINAFVASASDISTDNGFFSLAWKEAVSDSLFIKTSNKDFTKYSDIKNTGFSARLANFGVKNITGDKVLAFGMPQSGNYIDMRKYSYSEGSQSILLYPLSQELDQSVVTEGYQVYDGLSLAFVPQSLSYNDQINYILSLDVRSLAGLYGILVTLPYENIVASLSSLLLTSPTDYDSERATHSSLSNFRGRNALSVFSNNRSGNYDVYYVDVTDLVFIDPNVLSQIPSWKQYSVSFSENENVGSPKIASNDDGLTVITGVDPTGRIYIKRYLF